MTKKILFLSLILIFLVNLIIHQSSLNNDFVWDDYFMVKENSLIKEISFTGLSKFFSFKTTEPYLYIPITFLSLAIDYQMGKDNPFYYHLTNLLLHTANAFFIFILAFKWTNNKKIAMGTALLFSVNTIQVESIYWITERKNILSVFFFLLSYILYLKKNKKIFYTLSVISFTLSVYSKILTVTLPLILILHDYMLENNFSFKKIYYKYIPFFIISVSTAFIHLFIMPAFHTNARYDNLTFTESVITLLVIYGKSFIMGIFPINLNIIYIDEADIKSLPLLEVSIFTLLSLAVIISAIYLRNRITIISFGLLWYIITMAPHLTRYKYKISICDRYLYLPVIGICLIISVLLEKIYRINRIWRYISAGLFIIIILIYSILTIQYGNIWKNNQTLWEHAREKIPNNTFILKNLGIAYMNNDNIDEAINKFNIIISAEPDNYDIYIQKGMATEKKGDYEEAIKVYEKALKINPSKVEAYMQLGSIYYRVKKYDLSYEAYEKALKIAPERKDIKDFLPYLKELKNLENKKSGGK